MSKALDKMIDAVEAGRGDAFSIYAKRLSSAARDRGAYWPSHDVEKAFSGSIDAAKALHEALLPSPWSCILTVLPRAGAANLHWRGNMEPAFTGISANPARAWLIAILRAYRHTQGEAGMGRHEPIAVRETTHHRGMTP